MSDWEEVRHSVALLGLVTEEKTGKPIGGAVVTITGMPKEFKVKSEMRVMQVLRPGYKQTARIDETQTDYDGHFYFMDLPVGSYTVSASTAGRNPALGSGEGRVTVNKDGRYEIAAVDITVKRKKSR
jgi:carboxypeptidase family protein